MLVLWCGMAHCCSRPPRKGEPADCEERPNAVAKASQPFNQPLNQSASQLASQKVSKQASKQARKEGWQLAVFLASQGAGERFAASFLHAPLLGRSDHGLTTDHGGRTDIHGT